MAAIRNHLPIILVLSLSFPESVRAGFIYQVQSVVSNTAGEQPEAGLGVINLINQSGFVNTTTGLTTSYDSGVTDFDSFVAETRTSGGGWNSAAFQRGGTMVFDLGSQLTLTAMALWNHSNFYGQAIAALTITVDADGDFSSGATVVGAFTTDPAYYDTHNRIAKVFEFSATAGRFVKWDFSNFSNGFGTRAEGVAFEAIEGALGVPEPASVAMWGLGALSMMFARWKRRQILKAA